MASQRVAVVVPIYNVEAYLEECLRSLEAQSIWRETDVVLVDDGSTDGSTRIAQAFADRHPQVTLLRQANQGQGAARNRGLAEVRAPLVTFLDADDRLPPRALERLRTEILRAEADIAVGNMQSFPVVRKWRWQSALEEPGLISSLSERPLLIRSASVCNKLFRTSTFSGGKPFGEKVAFEDAYVSIPRMLEARRIVILGEVTYHYRKRPDGTSTMDSLFTRAGNYWDHVLLAEFLAEAAEGSSAVNKELILRYNVDTLLGFVARAADVFEGQELAEYFSRCKAVIGDAPNEVFRAAATNAFLAKAAFALKHCGSVAGFIRVMRADELRVSGRRLFLDATADWSQGARSWVREDEADSDGYERAELILVPTWRALVEGVDVTPEGALRVVGRIAIPGLPLESAQERVVPGIRIGKRLYRGRWEPRRVDGAEGARDWSFWVVEVPARRLRAGTFNIAFVLNSVNGGGAARKRALPTRGALRSARVLVLPRARAVLHYQRHPLLQLEISTGSRARRSMRARLLKLDLLALVRRQPMSLLRLLRLLTRPFFRGRPVVLYGERGDTAQDNGFVQFSYARERDQKSRSFFVIDRAAVRALGLGGLREGIVRRDSLFHRILMLHARILVSSYDFDAYMLPRTWDVNHYRRNLAWRVGAHRVFLQHGIVINGVGVPLGRGTTGFSRFVCSSGQELAYLEQTTGYSRELVATGLPRFDLLERRPSERPIIALMPTWRKYLVARSYVVGESDPGTFPGSSYEQFFAGLLQDEKLAAALEEHDASLVLVPHYEIYDHLAGISFGSDRIELRRGEGATIRELISSATVCVSDFSSVVFDAALAGVPVIHAPFDEEEFHQRHYPRGWFDVERDGVGPVCRSVDEVVEMIQHYLDADGSREPEYDKRAACLFIFERHRSRESVLREIQGLL